MATTFEVSMSTLLAALGRDSTARVRRAIRPLGLGAQQFLVLSQLRVLGEASQAELADAAGVDRSNLATLVNELCDRGLVARTRHELDRRRWGRGRRRRPAGGVARRAGRAALRRAD